MKRSYLIFILVMAFMLGGCAVVDALRAPVDTSAAEAKAAQLEQDLASLKTFIATQIDNIAKLKAYIAEQDGRLAEARAAAESSQSAAAIAVVKGLEAMQATAQASLDHTQHLLEGGQKYLPELQNIVAQERAGIADLKQGGDKVPLWMMLGTLALPFVTPLVGRIPVVGPFLGPVMGAIAKNRWEAYATSEQKAADAQAEAKAKALDYQVDVTHAVLGALTKAQRNDHGIDDLLQIERARQIRDGVHETLQPLVAAREATPSPSVN